MPCVADICSYILEFDIFMVAIKDSIHLFTCKLLMNPMFLDKGCQSFSCNNKKREQRIEQRLQLD